MSPISITAAEKNSREVNDYLLTMKLFVTVCLFWSSAIITTAILAGSLKIFRSQVCWYSFSNFAAEITTRSHCILYTTFHKLLKAWHKKHTSQNSWENCFDIAFMDMRYSRTRHSSSVWYLPSRIYIMARNNLSQQLKNKQVRSYNFLLTDRSETFKANGEASFNRFSAKVHHSSSNLATSLSWLDGRLSFKAYRH